MTAILQWLALLMCVVCTIWRLPSMLRGHNKGLFGVFVMASVSVALSIPSIYLPVDALLGGRNVANVILRLSLFFVFFLLSAKIAAAYNSPLALKLIRGPLGLGILIACAWGVVITYSMSEVNGSSTAMANFLDQPTIFAYMMIGKLYQAYAAIILIIPTGRAALANRPALDRAAAMSMCLGFILVAATALLQATRFFSSALMGILSFTAILLVAAGLAMIWISFLRRPLTAHDLADA